jgi:hypothetical protein
MIAEPENHRKPSFAFSLRYERRGAHIQAAIIRLPYSSLFKSDPRRRLTHSTIIPVSSLTVKAYNREIAATIFVISVLIDHASRRH